MNQSVMGTFTGLGAGPARWEIAVGGRCPGRRKTTTSPIHIGDPAAIGITDLSRPAYGEPVPIDAQEIPVFWGCGVTPQAVAEKARVDLMITHEPGQMFVTDLPREGGRRA